VKLFAWSSMTTIAPSSSCSHTEHSQKSSTVW
jgi:hypothetical protein